ncbi:MAG: phage scaffolding protein [Bacteroidales bacterium]|nr:phage scaffolding protein [Clostridium sp.]MCM1204742.1 phage scaffolding protein [Bacteroidales bacterium]
MTEEDLKELGLNDDQISKVFAKYNAEHAPMVKELDRVKADLETEKEKTASQGDTIKELKKGLEEFKDVDVTALNKKIEDLEEENRKKDSEHQQQLADRDFNDILKESILQAKGRNAKAITALLDIESLKNSKNQKEDIAAAIKMLTEAEDSKMLFGEPDAKPVGSGNPIGNVVTGTKPQDKVTLLGALEEKYKQ